MRVQLTPSGETYPAPYGRTPKPFFSDKLPSEQLFEYATQSGGAGRPRHVRIEILVRATRQEAYPGEQASHQIKPVDTRLPVDSKWMAKGLPLA
jgi:hypothetical protein